MAQADKTPALILEKDRELSESISKSLKRRSYAVTSLSARDEALALIKEQLVPLAIVGNAEGDISPFESMKDIVMASPMTSMVLITDLPKEEVEDKAEGYGILGHVGRKEPARDLMRLVKSFEEIFGAFHPSAKD